ncbi:hypothetical protein H9P43_006416 [Blastocladiella emersonii ATCC 22665]|nr:hypothetical protein H9P43_006416 [Blastocladiella emersonii ATCC 22665]
MLPRPATLVRALTENPAVKWAAATAERVLPPLAAVCMRILGPILLVVACALIGACAWIFFAMLMPESRPDNVWSVAGLAWAAVYGAAALLVVDIFFNYWMAVRTTSYAEDVARDDEDAAMSAAKVCRRCNAPKPERCHHCSVCKRCVLKMDHHCPWLNNCVGHHNHRYFVVFLVYVSLACILFTCFSAPYAPDAFFPFAPWPHAVARDAFLFCFLVTTLLGLLLSGMAGWHVYLAVVRGETQLEWMENAEASPPATSEFNLGWRENLAVVLNTAARPWWYVLLPLPVPPVGNGFMYETAASRAIALRTLHRGDGDEASVPLRRGSSDVHLSEIIVA